MLLFLQFGSFLSTCVGFYVLLKYYLLCGCAYVRQDHLFRRLLPQFCNAMDTRALIQEAAAIVLQCHRYYRAPIQQASDAVLHSYTTVEYLFRRLLPQFHSAMDNRALIQKAAAIDLQCHRYYRAPTVFSRLVMQFCNAIDTRALIQKATAVVLQCHRYQSTYSEGCCRIFVMPQILQSRVE